MMDLVRRINVFVSSPSDVAEERDSLEKIVQDLNRGAALPPNTICTNSLKDDMVSLSKAGLIRFGPTW
jgi:hypothetical protein